MTDVDAKDIVAAAEYLRDSGMDVELLRDLHHFALRDQTYSSVIGYFAKGQALRGTNQLFGNKLYSVAEEHRRSGRPFAQIVSEARARFGDPT